MSDKEEHVSVSWSHENPEENFISHRLHSGRNQGSKARGVQCTDITGHWVLGPSAVWDCWGFVTRTEERGRKEGVGLHIEDQFLVPRYHKLRSLRQQCKQDVGFL